MILFLHYKVHIKEKNAQNLVDFKVCSRSKKLINCLFCQRSFRSLGGCAMHLRKIHMRKTLDAGVNSASPFPHQGPKKPFKCSACKASFATVRIHARHMAAVHGGQTFMCPHCHLPFNSTSDLALHNEKFHGLAKIKDSCQLCTQLLVGTNEYKVHMQKAHHEELNPFACPACNKKFSKLKFRDLHVNRVHGNSLACPICPELFFQSVDLDQHLYSHF
jgi:uncharacterized C2H2 Zn-finger protein